MPEVSCAHTDASVYSELMLILNVQVAPMVDQGLFQLEGMVPWGNNNTYKMPVNVYVFGPPDPAHADMVKHRLLRAGMQIGSWGKCPNDTYPMQGCRPEPYHLLHDQSEQSRQSKGLLETVIQLASEGSHSNQRSASECKKPQKLHCHGSSTPR